MNAHKPNTSLGRCKTAAIGLLLVVLPFCAGAMEPSTTSLTSQYFRLQYNKPDLSFCNSSVCVDFDGDGKRELLFASRKTKRLEMLNASDGAVLWSRKFDGEQQSLSAFDLDGDGDFEILYSTSGPGRLHVLDQSGETIKQWDSGDWKLGNSPVILDADADGQLDGFFGTRSKYLVRLNMSNLTLVNRRVDWVQCGCYTSAMDVDHDGHWDLFAGSGDDSNGKGIMHRYDPLTLKSVWSYKTNDNASSADPVLADLDGDGQVEIVKSVDNYAGDGAHDAIYAFETSGELLWKATGFAGEDSPNVADLDDDGEVEIVGMTFGCEVYCLNSLGQIKWQKDLRHELNDAAAHAYVTPILCDLNGDRQLEILAMTNGGYFDLVGKSGRGRTAAPGIVFALASDGEILDQFALDSPRYWGSAFICNLDDDPYLELVVSGSGGLDVIETTGFGPNNEHFQRRRNYQRLNVLPWAYKDTYFIDRGTKDGVVHRTDNLVLAKRDGQYLATGTFTTELLVLPPGCIFDEIQFETIVPKETAITVNILDRANKPLTSDVQDGSRLHIDEPVRLECVFTSTKQTVSPTLDSYSLRFRRLATRTR